MIKFVLGSTLIVGCSSGSSMARPPVTFPSTVSAAPDSTTVLPAISIVPEPTHPALSKTVNDSQPLVNGDYVAFLNAIDLGSKTAVVDIAEWLTGPAAVQAAIGDGHIRPGEALPNDYYLRNVNPLTRRVPLATPVTVTVARCPTGCATYAGTLEGLAQALSHPDPHADLAAAYRPASLYWLRIVDGEIVRIDEQYRP